MKRLCVLLAGLSVSAFTAMQIASAADLYVATNGTGDGSSWANATNRIQGAIDAISGAYTTNTVWVSNGVYETGGVTNYPSGTVLTNRIVINKAITVRSANNDPTNTIIKGAWDPTTTNGPASVRCVYMTNNSSLIGFTLTNGATLTANESAVLDDRHGGGIWCQSTSAYISNCVISCNRANSSGGGTYKGTLYNSTLSANDADWGGGIRDGNLYNCTLSGNNARVGGGAGGCTMSNCTVTGNGSLVKTENGGGVYEGTLYNCSLISNKTTYPGGTGGGSQQADLYNCMLTGNQAGTGGGSRSGTLRNCTLSGNMAKNGGGVCGISAGIPNTLYNCMIVGNQANDYGGGISDFCILYNCTIVGNHANSYGGGANGGVMYNSIVYFNDAPSGSNWNYGSFTNSCTTTAQVDWAVGNITSDPMFIDKGSGYGTNHVAGNYRLSASSPCINAGTNQSWMTNSYDLDGRARIRYGTVDMGAYERLNAGTIYCFH